METRWAVVKVIPRLGLYKLVGEEITETGSFSNEGKNLHQIAAEVSSHLKNKCTSLAVGFRLNQSSPERDEGSEGDSGEEVSGKLVVTCCDAPEVFQATEGILDEMAALVALCVVSDRALAI